MESILTLAIFLALLLVIAVPYWLRTVRRKRQALQSYQKNVKAGFTEVATLHPRIDVLRCIGCASCVRVCPENVLGIIEGRAAIINGTRCIGHALCAEACPVGAITMGFGSPKQGMEIPYYDEHYQTNIEGLYIVGELGGIGLIRNAIAQGVKAVDHLAARPRTAQPGAVDVAIIGAGPAGIGAALAAKSHNVEHVVLEQDNLGGSVLHYPRQKLVLTTPVELPLFGKLKVSEITKEQLMETFVSLVDRFDLKVQTQKRVEMIVKTGDMFSIRTATETIQAANVILALGRRGSPRKLGVPGEDLPKVYYRLIEAETYQKKRLLVVGGGDSAVEAAAGLARQKGNTVTVSYRRGEFLRLKEKNEQQIREMMKSGALRVIFNSEVREISPDSVTLLEGGKTVHTLPNDHVFIFAGGELPAEFLKKIGVTLRTEDMGTGAASVLHQ
jgi:thioredoxin reductase (NADPH)